MKFRRLLLAAGLTAVMVMAGCGQDSAEDTTAQETEQTEEVSTEETEQTEDAAESIPEDESTAEADSQTDAGDSQAENAGEEQTYEDNFAVDSEADKRSGCGKGYGSAGRSDIIPCLCRNSGYGRYCRDKRRFSCSWSGSGSYRRAAGICGFSGYERTGAQYGRLCGGR